VFDYGLTSEAFWRLTPAQFWAVSKRYDQGVERQEFGPALVTSTIVNALRGKNDAAVSPRDFMPSFQEHQEAPSKSSATSVEQSVALAHYGQLLFGGVITSGN